MADWRSQAACRGCGPDLFFGDRGDHTTIREAKKVCAICPVTAECLEEWSTLPSDSRVYGVWGGTGDHDRRQLKLLSSTQDKESIHV